MDGLLNIVSSAAALNAKQFLNVLHGFDEHQAFGQRAPNELESTIALITNNLNSHDQKYEGLLLLKTFATQCQLDVIEQKGSLWISLCTKVCAQKKPAAAVCLAYDILIDLLEKSIHVPDLSKSIANNLLSKLIETVNGLSAECHLAALKCIDTCMRLYAGPCGSLRGIIERFLDTLIDDSDVAVVRQTGKCHHLLQQVRGGGTQGVKSKDAWALLQLKLVYVLHEALDAIYSHTSETADGNVHGASDELMKAVEKWPKLTLSAEPVARVTMLFNRFRNLCEFLRVALSEPFPTAKLIQPERILAVVTRGLGVNCQTLGRNAITDNIAVGALLPQIHISLFNLLDTLILLLGTNLLAETKTICQLITQTLRWTSSGKVAGFKRPYSTIRQAAYRTLVLWCKVAKSGSLVELISDDLIKHIIQDVTPYQGEVTLQVLSGSRKFLSKKARQRLHKAQNDASNIAQTHSKAFNPHNTKIIYSDNGNEALCVHALNALAQFILVTGCFLKPVHQKILQENIVGIALRTVTAQPKKTNLYYLPECRHGLYTVLYALIISPHHLCPPPVQYAAKVFSVAQVRDSSESVRERCANYLRAIEKLLHPKKEIFYFPTEASEVVDAFRKSIDRHRLDNGGHTSTADEESDIEMEENLSKPESTSPAVASIDELNGIAGEHQSPVATIGKTIVERAASPQFTCSVRLSHLVDELKTPRKSARLSSASPATHSGTESESRSKTDSPAPRRKSARLNSTSIHETTETVDQLNAPTKKLLPTIAGSPATSPIKDKSETTQIVDNEDALDNAYNNKSVDDLVNEMVSAFVEEFVDNTEDDEF